MEFEWDPAKHERNMRERGIGFDAAARIFAGRVIESEDRRHDYGEMRMRAVGVVEGKLFTVVYTERDGVRRIISARSASRRERMLWHA